MSADHLVTLLVVVAVLWLTMRWGQLIFLGYALWYACTGQWFFAGTCFVFMCLIGAIKAPAMFVARQQGYRGSWL